jgi:putative membrane protein
VKQLFNRGSLLAPATAIFVYVLQTSSAMAQQSPPYYGPHPWWGSEWMFFGPLMMIICVVAVVVLAVLLVRWFGGSGQSIDRQSAGKTPLDILRERFARGEIEKEEFDERRRILGA